MAIEGVRNYMEDLVGLYLREMMVQMDVCPCEKCTKDVFAITLNSLKPMYVVTSKGQAMVKTHLLESQFKADVIAALICACKKVNEEKRHES
ncbi:MAG: late competence development ComFB family protein [Cellulosilyticaceae bacterium]